MNLVNDNCRRPTHTSLNLPLVLICRCLSLFSFPPRFKTGSSRSRNFCSSDYQADLAHLCTADSHGRGANRQSNIHCRQWQKSVKPKTGQSSGMVHSRNTIALVTIKSEHAMTRGQQLRWPWCGIDNKSSSTLTASTAVSVISHGDP